MGVEGKIQLLLVEYTASRVCEPLSPILAVVFNP